MNIISDKRYLTRYLRFSIQSKVILMNFHLLQRFFLEKLVHGILKNCVTASLKFEAKQVVRMLGS
ncbi:hypothetical protein HS7_15040 [Sulfolobales archaeon HS-7]|nr:hypothetical protein HS7_15040 [Sulfolobales archaeon HS-7]